MCLIRNNAKVAAQIAVALESLNTDCGNGEKLHAVEGLKLNKPAPVVIGGSILDVHYQVLDDNLEVSSNLSPPELKRGLNLKTSF